MPRFFRRFSVLLVILALGACAPLPKNAAPESHADSMAQLGDHLRQKGELEGAVSFYRRALASEPGNLKAITGLAQALQQWGDKDGVAQTYREAILARPQDAQMHYFYGKALIALDAPIEARRQFERALSLDNDPKIRSALAVALDYLGEHVKAQRHYEKALNQTPNDLSIMNNLAYSYILSRDYRRAIQTLEPVADKPSASPALRQNLALAYGLAGMDADAERMARKDLSPEKVQENMAYYRAQRAELEMSKAPYAELGTYATEEMAIAQIKKIKTSAKNEGKDLQAVVLPEVSAPGGTPRFAVRMLGCTRPSDVTRLCDTLAKVGIPCVARGKGGE